MIQLTISYDELFHIFEYLDLSDIINVNSYQNNLMIF